MGTSRDKHSYQQCSRCSDCSTSTNTSHKEQALSYNFRSVSSDCGSTPDVALVFASTG
jgi:hypothetical protein